MKVLLVDVDSTIPNLALMQISTWHKDHGDEVTLLKGEYESFDTLNADKVYVSCIFRENRAQVLGILTIPKKAEIVLGGPGLNWDWLPAGIQKVKPDYDLYPGMEYSLGFTTRGCIRRCPWCVVPKKEGALQRWQRVEEFHDERLGTVRLLDNNILADPEWFRLNTEFLLQHDLALIEEGMDVRLLTPSLAARLAEIRLAKPLKFAFDTMAIEPAVLKGIQILQDAGINTKRNVLFYVLVGYDGCMGGIPTTQEEDIYRCRLLREHRTGAFVMQFRSSPWTRRLAAWANRPQLFWPRDLDETDYAAYRSQ